VDSAANTLRKAGKLSMGVKEMMLANHIEDVALWAVGSLQDVALYLNYFPAPTKFTYQ